MKVQMTFKTPDVVCDTLDKVYQEAYTEAESQQSGCDCGGHCVDCDRMGDTCREEAQLLKENAKAVFDQFIQHDEYITVEFDLEARTCVVLGRSLPK